MSELTLTNNKMILQKKYTKTFFQLVHVLFVSCLGTRFCFHCPRFMNNLPDQSGNLLTSITGQHLER